MGKKHFSGDTPGRRGRSTGRPTGNSNGPEGFRKFSQPGRNRDDRGAGDTPRFGGRDEARGSDRPSFGRPAEGSFTGPKKFGTSNAGGPKKFGNSGGFNRGGEGRPGGFGQRSGSRDFGGNNRRFEGDNRRPGGFGGEERRDERPVRPFEPKKSWGGQPYSQEGKPTVPRGLPGERNRRFVKQNPNEQDQPRPENFRPRESRPDADRGTGFGGEREVRAARPFDYRGRPEDLPADRSESRGENRGGNDRRSERPARRDNDFGNDRPARREGGFGGGSFGEKRTARPGSFNGDKREGRSFGAERSEGFRQPREERPKRAHDEFVGRGAQTPNPNQAGKRKFGEVEGQAPDYKNLKFYEEDKSRGNKRRREEDDLGADEVRLNRYIANAGICSRREADSLIAAGEIKVNGQVVTEMGYKVQPSDTVQYGKTNLNREKLVYVLLNKPKDYITTTDDPEGRRTVMELVKGASKERVFPVGRLDRNTTGLLLFTNDGEVAQKLSHPSHRNKKIYQVELDKPLTEEHLRQIAEGLELEDGKAEVDDVAVVAGNPHFVGVEIHIGRNRIVRRIFEHLGYDVVTLDRVQYAGLTKKDLPRGKWRFLNEKEVIRLKYFM
ncbi:pseudouridine synthase [Hymenobacter sublimis]|uniref:Pseudouridine synthase n=1 Tax=Hymenobacter sublimis TaxID=2933777 RepID=A0ABY4J8G3_9BACT|nr:pseudouridine synthase [Hymenobacter sublimis]UPL49102.1 pseudouridine synthase [Hymenobacter sublimis]